MKYRAITHFQDTWQWYHHSSLAAASAAEAVGCNIITLIFIFAIYLPRNDHHCMMRVRALSFERNAPTND